MIPAEEKALTASTQIERLPSENYLLHPEDGTIAGRADGLGAMQQVIYKILHTERYDYIIYSWNYGIEIKDLFGEPVSFVCSELEDRITEALCQDDRIEAVSGFQFEFPKKGTILVSFTVHTIFGDLQDELEVESG